MLRDTWARTHTARFAMIIKTDRTSPAAGARPAFSLLRTYPSLSEFIAQQPRVLLHAPSGSGKRTAVLQWLYAHKRPFTWLRWGDPNPAGVDVSALTEVRLLQAADEFRQILCDGDSEPDGRYLVIEISRCAGDAFPWDELLACCQQDDAARNLIVVTSYLGGSTKQALRNTLAYRSCFDDLALSAGEIATLAELTLAERAHPSLGECLFALSHGWARGIFAAFGDESHTKPGVDPVHVLQERCRQVVAVQVERAFSLYPGMAQALALLQQAGPLPTRIYEAQGPLAHQQTLIRIARAFAWIHNDVDRQQAHWARCGSFAQALLHAVPQRLDEAELIQSAAWLEANGFETAAIRLLLRAQRWTQLEALLLAVSDRLIANLQVMELGDWLRALDGERPIRHPRLLLNAVRCGIYQGNRLETELYFQRLLEQVAALQPKADANVDSSLPDVKNSMPGVEWSRFSAELLLYARLLKQGEALCEQWSGWSEQAMTAASSTHLLQQAFVHAESGDLARAYPLLAAGLRRSEAHESAPRIIAYASIYFWVLVLSCQTEQAQQFLDETRSKMVQEHVAFRGVYDCLDLLTILLTRVRGEVDATCQWLERLLASQALSQDFLRQHVVLNVQADLCLARHDFYAARHAIAQLAALQKSPATRSYWFPSAELMQTCLTLFEQGKDGAPPDIPSLGKNLGEIGGIQKQTELLWTIKMHLYWHTQEDLLPVLDEFAALCTRTGQWLRLLEVDLLRALCLYRQTDKRRALALFASVTDQLRARGTEGVLVDPFLMWSEFLRHEVDLKHRDWLLQLYRQIRPDAPDPIATPSLQEPAEKLSRREREILALLARGLRNQDIADSLHVSITTVRSHVQNIYRKLQVANRPAATAAAIQNGLV